jgi:hypothetical protein
VSASLLALACVGSAAAPAAEAPALLPRLVADPPDGALLVTSGQEDSTRLLLRFNGYVHNAGSGAVEFRGGRAAPQADGLTQTQLNAEVREYGRREESLPVGLEEELATPAMNVSQRLYTTNAGNPSSPQTYLERAHVERPSDGQLIYSSSDGHHHWHLQKVARYSLWNADRGAEVASAQKVGFCLNDSEHVEPGKGPSSAVYRPVWPETGSCRRFEPNATAVYQGISPGWRDVYDRGLAFQWIDVSELAPGEYWLREEVDPGEVVIQEGGPASAFAATTSIVPGFDAQPQAVALEDDSPSTITLSARGYGESELPTYAIATGPAHGTLSPVEGDQVTYTPDPGFAGSDSFTFSASDPDSAFPDHPVLAAVSLAVASRAPSISISGSQAAVRAGTSLALTAAVTNDDGGVEWEASGGSIQPAGEDGLQALFDAPQNANEGSVAITARLRDDPAVSDSRSIEIEPSPVAEPAPEEAASGGDEPGSAVTAPPTGVPATEASGAAPESAHAGSAPAGAAGAAPLTAKPVPAVWIANAALAGRVVIVTADTRLAGRLEIEVRGAGRELGSCQALTPAGRRLTCRVRLPHGLSTRAAYRLRARLQSRGHVFVAGGAPARISEMAMARSSAPGHSADGFWCSPAALSATG